MSADNKLSHQSTNNKEIGKTFVSEKFSSTIDSFWIIINSSVLINPFDFVSVDNKNNTKTIGIVKELQRTFLFFDSKLYKCLRIEPMHEPRIYRHSICGVSNIFLARQVQNL